jgi:hypothetical protein
MFVFCLLLIKNNIELVSETNAFDFAKQNQKAKHHCSDYISIGFVY